jgi:uncharacterized protein DUF3768
MNSDDPDRERMLNDALRKNPEDREVLLHADIFFRGPEFVQKVLQAISGDQNFASDAVGHHDSGVVTVDGQRFKWWIDVFEHDFETKPSYPRNPADRRVLTIAPERAPEEPPKTGA